MYRNSGILFAVTVCCVWPLVVHVALTLITRGAIRINKIDMDALRDMLPWRRNK